MQVLHQFRSFDDTCGDVLHCSQFDRTASSFAGFIILAGIRLNDRPLSAGRKWPLGVVPTRALAGRVAPSNP